MKLAILFLSVSFCTMTYAKDVGDKRLQQKSLAMILKKQKVTLASTLPIDRPTPMTSDSLREGSYEGAGTIGNVPGLLGK